MAMTRTGGGCDSITRICTVLVWLRSMVRRQIEVVQRVARGMGRGDVQGVEVMPGVLDFGAAGHAEAEAAEEVDQLVGRSGSGDGDVPAWDGSGKRDIDRLGGHVEPFEPRFGRLERASSPCLTALNRWP